MTIQIQSDNAIKWLEALLSGEYKQGKEMLGDDKRGYCCWGVGCKVIGLKYSPIDGWDDDLYKYIGFDNRAGDLKIKFYNKTTLAAINDNTTAGFKRIAKFLIKTADLHFVKKVAENITNHFNKSI